MCKLCNTDRPSIKPINKLGYHAIVHDYIGEYCCSQCNAHLFSTIRNNKEVEKIILYKLYHAYRGFDSKTLGRAKNRQKVTRTSLFGIVITTHPTRETAYAAKVQVGLKGIYIGVFSTLKEALEAKLAYCIEHKHVRSIKHIQNKLKELQCKN